MTMLGNSVARLLIGSALAGLCPALAFAQPVEPASPTDETVAPDAASEGKAAASEGGDIVVTAQKIEQRLIDVPQSVSVISARELENVNAQSLVDYLNRVPSAQVVEPQPGQARVILRGINTGGVGATVATYIDETPYGSATALANGATTAPDLDPFELARVEVLRGPQGTLYGANSLGGLVKYVTLVPDLGAVGGRAEVGYEHLSHGDGGPFARAGLNLPLGDIAAMRITGHFRKQPGWVDDPNFGKDVNDGKTYGGRASVLVRPTDQLDLRASLLVQSIRSDGSSTVDVNPVTLSPAAGRYEQVKLARQPSDTDYKIYNLTGAYDFGPMTLLSSTSYGKLDQDQVRDFSGQFGPLLSFIFGLPLGAAADSALDHRRFTQEVRLSSSGERTIQWVGGLFYTRERNRLRNVLNGIDATTLDPFAALAGLIDIELPSRYREIAGFANATINFSEQFDLTFGGRYSHNKQRSVQTSTGLLIGGTTVFEGKSSEGVFTYSVAPSFKPNRDTTIYARVAKGYRPGGPNAVSPLAPSDVPRVFDSDTTINYEVGIKSQVIPRTLHLEATAFYVDWEDIQLLTVVEGIGVNANGGSARSTGFEFAATTFPAEGLSLNASAAYVNAKLTSDAPASVGALDGDRLPYSPRWSSALALDYRHAIGGRLTANYGASLRYTGKRKSGFDPALGQQTLGSYTTIDAYAGVEFDRFRIEAFARNLTNSRGILELGEAGSALNGNLAAAIVRPRSIGFSLGYRY